MYSSSYLWSISPDYTKSALVHFQTIDRAHTHHTYIYDIINNLRVCVVLFNATMYVVYLYIYDIHTCVCEHLTLAYGENLYIRLCIYTYIYLYRPPPPTAAGHWQPHFYMNMKYLNEHGGCHIHAYICIYIKIYECVDFIFCKSYCT